MFPNGTVAASGAPLSTLLIAGVSVTMPVYVNVITWRASARALPPPRGAPYMLVVGPARGQRGRGARAGGGAYCSTLRTSSRRRLPSGSPWIQSPPCVMVAWMAGVTPCSDTSVAEVMFCARWRQLAPCAPGADGRTTYTSLPPDERVPAGAAVGVSMRGRAGGAHRWTVRAQCRPTSREQRAAGKGRGCLQ